MHDYVILTGGLRGTTSVADRSTMITNTGVYEYAPPTSADATVAKARTQGTWAFIPSCSGFPNPPGRYGHSLGYDTLNHQLVMVGGYDTFGNLLAQTHTYEDGSTTDFPEVWTARRVTTWADA